MLNDGTIRSAGSNISGMLGNGAWSDSSVPVQVSGINNALAVSSFNDGACALLATGAVSCWGGGNDGELGNGTSGFNTLSNVPVSVSNLNDATSIAAGNFFTCAVRSAGNVVCWGDNYWGELGNGTTGSLQRAIASHWHHQRCRNLSTSLRHQA